MFHELDLSLLTVEQMKAIIKIVNWDCGGKDKDFKPYCKLCMDVELELWTRKAPGDFSGVDICACG